MIEFLGVCAFRFSLYINIDIIVPCIALQADLLHPLTSLGWWRCERLPFDVLPVQAAALDEMLCVVGEESAQSCGHKKPRGLMHLYTDTSSTHIKVPTRRSAFTTYRGKLVLVGGKKLTSEHGYVTSKVYIRTLHPRDGSWSKLPPMLTKRHSASVLSYSRQRSEYLLVAGGEGDEGAGTAVEYFDGVDEWWSVDSLPKEGKDMTSAFLNGEWILMGGTLCCSVFIANVKDLIGMPGNKVWRTYEAPLEKSCAVVFRNHLLAIGGKSVLSDVEGGEGTMIMIINFLRRQYFADWLKKQKTKFLRGFNFTNHRTYDHDFN